MSGADRLEVGRVVSAHALSGEVVVAPVTDRDERFAPGSTLYSASHGDLEIARSRRHKGGWLVQFAGIDDRSAAEAMRGVVLLADGVEGPPESGYWVHELIGSAVVDTADRPVGTVVSVQDNPAHDLLVLDSGALVPVVFVVEQRAGTVIVDPPDGLFEI